MLRNYLLVALRNLKRHFTYSFVNIFGLTVGLACTLIIGIWVHQEYSYDKHFDEAESIYRVGVNFYGIGNMSIGPEILLDKLEEYTDVEHVTAMGQRGTVTFIVEKKEIAISKGFKADQHFFDVFSYPFLQGTAATAMKEPNTVVLTASTAIQLFGHTNVLNESLEIKDDPNTYKVSGVVDGSNLSHIPANMWFSWKASSEARSSWTSASSYVYVKLKGPDPAKRLDQILDEQIEDIYGVIAPEQTLAEFKNSGMYVFLPMPIGDIHLKSSLKFEPSSTGNKQTVDVFGGIALLILTLASINFINISTARATTRAKEVGVRKSLGTNRSELIVQFTLESILICLIAVSMAIGIGEMFLNVFEELTGLELLPTLFAQSTHFLFVYLGAIFLGILAGSYPAIYITRFKAVNVLKGNLDTNEKGATRNGLVLFQFAISICLLIVSMFIFHQLRFIENKDMGFDMENVMVVDNIGSLDGKGQRLKEELLRQSYVKKVSLSDRVPASNSVSLTSVKTESDKEVWIQHFAGDEDQMACIGFRLLEGRDFDSNRMTDTAAIILNESAVAELELTDPIGQTLSDGRYRIIGIISDFNYESMKKQIGAAMLTLDREEPNNLSIKFSADQTEVLIANLNDWWSKNGSNEDASFYFLDENFARLVEREKVLSQAVLVFTVLAMFISCLGLYGLSIFTAERRTKEIGIRRVLGASVSSITTLLSKNFAKPIAIAFLIACPLAYYITNDWLSDYAYRIDIDWLPFLTGGAIALGMGILTIAWQSVRAALKNPVVSLRNE